MTVQVGGLSADELVVLDKITEVHAFIRDRVMADGESRSSHMRDVTFYVHGLQTIIMSQAAARAYPDEFRMLGA